MTPDDARTEEPTKAWRFTTDVYPPADRLGAWREAATQLRLPIERLYESDPFQASISCLTSPLGMEFAVMKATPQEFSGRNSDQRSAVWLSLLLEGEAVLDDGEGALTLRPGDIAYGPTGVAASLRFLTPFRQMFISAPRVALDHRLIAPLSLRIGRLQGASGSNAIFAGLLRAAADILDDLTGEDLRPVELALTEFLIAGLAAEGTPASKGGATGARRAHLHRICQIIETRLAEPELTLAQIAEEDGISTRYLQKLFTAAGQSFTQYVRLRRLERCRADLTTPLCATLSISEICFRWGFNGSAHFSRAFRDAYHQSPRDYRRQAQTLE